MITVRLEPRQVNLGSSESDEGGPETSRRHCREKQCRNDRKDVNQNSRPSRGREKGTIWGRPSSVQGQRSERRREGVKGRSRKMLN